MFNLTAVDSMVNNVPNHPGTCGGVCHSERGSQWGRVEAHSFPMSGFPSEWPLEVILSAAVYDVFLYNSAVFDVARISLFGSLVVEASAFIPC